MLKTLLSLAFTIPFYIESKVYAEANITSEKSCSSALLNQKVGQEEAKLLIQLNRSLTYGVTFYYKKIDGKERLLIVLTENPFKRVKQIEHAKQFFGNNNRPLLGDSEKMDSLPAASGHSVLLAISQYGNPLSLLFSIGKQPHRFADASAHNIEVGWEPTNTAKIGYSMNLVSRSLGFVRNLAGFAILADAVSGLALGPDYSLGLLPQIKDSIKMLPVWITLAQFKAEHSYLFGMGIPATYLAIRKFRKLGMLYPPVIFQQERAESLVSNIDQFWFNHPDVDQAVLVTGKYSSGALHWRMVREDGYEEILFSELYEIANGKESKTRLFGIRQTVRTTFQKWNRFRDRWIPPDEN